MQFHQTKLDPLSHSFRVCGDKTESNDTRDTAVKEECTCILPSIASLDKPLDFASVSIQAKLDCLLLLCVDAHRHAEA